jgi:hypothetical protein
MGGDGFACPAGICNLIWAMTFFAIINSFFHVAPLRLCVKKLTPRRKDAKVRLKFFLTA